MALSLRARSKVPASREACWDRLLHTDALLERLSHQSVRISRLAGQDPSNAGDSWEVGLEFAGMHHAGVLAVSDLQPPTVCRIAGGTDAIGVVMVVSMQEMPSAQTDMSVSLEVTPKTLSGRVLLKPLSFMKPALEKRFQHRVTWVVERMLEPV